MDYVTALSTLSVLLFKTHTNGPISMPLHTLMIDDVHCAWFLIDKLTPSITQNEAEQLVWSQIDRAKLFYRALGTLFASAEQGVGFDVLSELAGSFGLGLESSLPQYKLHLRDSTFRSMRVRSRSHRGSPRVAASERRAGSPRLMAVERGSPRLMPIERGSPRLMPIERGSPRLLPVELERLRAEAGTPIPDATTVCA